MSEKDEALRLAEELYAFHGAKKEMPSVGGQMLGLESYRIVASREAFSQILNAAEKLIRLHAENERLREALKWSLKNGVVYHRTYDAYEGFSDAGCSCCSSSIEPPPHLQEMILKIARREET